MALSVSAGQYFSPLAGGCAHRILSRVEGHLFAENVTLSFERALATHTRSLIVVPRRPRKENR